LHLWPIILEARKRGAKLVVVDPIRTRTAAEADWHIAPKPGSDPALMLAMMHVIIRDNLVDLDYVDRFANGYEPLKQRAADYAPESVTQVTGISAEEIERFATAYATTAPSMIRPLIGPEHHRNGAMFFRTLACLPILTGAWRHRGGGLSRSTHGLQYSALNMDRLLMPEVYKSGVRTLNMRDLGVDLCSQTLSPPIRSLCVWNVNPVVTIPNQKKVIQGLSREDLFVVAHELFVTETAKYADYVLPATSQIEHLDIIPAWGHHYLSFNRPAIEPIGESVSNTEFIRRLARALGRTEAWLYESDEELIRTALSSGHQALDGITYERLWEEGYARLNLPRDWKPFETGFPTRSGKADLWSDTLEKMGMDPLPSLGQMRSASGTQLQLITAKTLHFLNSSYSQIELHRRREGGMYVEVHAEDAAQRGFADGKLVRVWNQQGAVIAECRISDRVRPGVVWMPFGGWGDVLGRPLSVNTLTPEEPTDWGDGSGFYDAFVDIETA
ncbi:MAG: molybdopterin dinucleotide binding domain-containing protein, partial [Pirellula sp.]